MANDLEELAEKDPTAIFFQEVLRAMADDEERHRNYLKSMSNMLSDFCKCS
jgi:hypothetical protein